MKERMENNKSPWEVQEGGEVAELEFQRKTLSDMRGHIREYARQHDITVEIVGGRDAIRVGPADGNFEQLSDYISGLVDTVNGMLKQQHKNYAFVIHQKDQGLIIQAS